MIEYLKEYLKANDVEYKEKQKLANYSSIKIGGEAKIIAYPDTEKKLCDLIFFCNKTEIKNKTVGNLSNLLPLDEGYDGVIIKTDRLNRAELDRETVNAGCGVKLPRLATCLANASLSGFEGLYGIPGQVGGSVRGNAGAFGREIGELVLSCTVYSKDLNKVFELSGNELCFSYRSSSLASSDFTVLSVKFKLFSAYRDSILSEMQRCREIRKRTQPTEYPSLGSFFKRTKSGDSAARLIDMCGLKGMRVGGAAVSQRHAGFIINADNASSFDVLSLASLVEKRVSERFCVRLCPEVEILA
ncbi:MAG: UDP-N-acetylmuramate dehydrogenase [Clostridia bacterium]|nr:UDP-N-acetylmuramate dehydrogenase [Clostridia bacterium]